MHNGMENIKLRLTFIENNNKVAGKPAETGGKIDE
jgi:hypothetical protein